jgi:hypothetical protein
VDDVGAMDKFQSMRHLVCQFLGMTNGKTSMRDVEKELQSNAERLMNEEMVAAAALAKLKVDIMPV